MWIWRSAVPSISGKSHSVAAAGIALSVQGLDFGLDNRGTVDRSAAEKK
jgi:hypothetical protein